MNTKSLQKHPGGGRSPWPYMLHVVREHLGFGHKLEMGAGGGVARVMWDGITVWLQPL